MKAGRREGGDIGGASVADNEKAAPAEKMVVGPNMNSWSSRGQTPILYFAFLHFLSSDTLQLNLKDTVVLLIIHLSYHVASIHDSFSCN